PVRSARPEHLGRARRPVGRALAGDRLPGPRHPLAAAGRDPPVGAGRARGGADRPGAGHRRGADRSLHGVSGALVLERVFDSFMALPFITFAVAVGALLGNTIHAAMIAVG